MKIDELKEQWRKAKVKAGDFRGLGATRFRNLESDRDGMEIMFNSMFNDGTRHELEIEVEEIGLYCWTWKELAEEINKANENLLTVNFTVNIWNKTRSDADRKSLFSFTFIKD